MKNQPIMQPSPATVQALIQRADAIAGLSLGELAEQLQVAVPANFKRQKGWSGQLIEAALGACAGSKPTQDFPELGIELKTLPLSHDNTPLETTYVCYAPLTNIAGISWHTSNVRNKLRKVLWVPIQGEREIPVSDRIIGQSFLWQPSPEQDQMLQQDWEELMDLIALGQVESITARMGQYMQLRPKAANGKALTDAIGHSGSVIKTRPRGFYLRKDFTQLMLNQAFS